jgi:hypothetical protein
MRTQAIRSFSPRQCARSAVADLLADALVAMLLARSALTPPARPYPAVDGAEAADARKMGAQMQAAST